MTYTLRYPDGLLGDPETTLEDLAEQFLWANSQVVDELDLRFEGAVPCIWVGTSEDDKQLEAIFDVLSAEDLIKWEKLTK